VAEIIKEEILLERARSGDQDSFLLLYERYRNRVFRFLYRFLGSSEIAETLTHDCFISLINSSELPQSASGFRTRLYLSARTLAMKYLAKDHSTASGKVPNNETHIRREESEVAEAVARLPPLEREALILSEYEGLKLEEIASIVGTDVDAVAARVGSARRRLRSTLMNHLFSSR
jgi:RNA polymerase sigma-70 factor (ECF subfamily)